MERISPQTQSLKEKTLGAIQRDRLEPFWREAVQYNSGCVYVSLLIEWENLYPNQVLPRDIVEQFSFRDKHFVLKEGEMFNEVLLVAEKLGLVIKSIDITPFLQDSIDRLRAFYDIPKEIEIHKMEDSENFKILVLPSEGALVVWLNKDLSAGHMSAFHSSSRFRQEENFAIGGQREFDLAVSDGKLPIVIIHLARKTGNEVSV